jgi:hypothetical protein
MARIRTVKPEFWEDEIIGRLSRDARLLFIATFNMADDEGRLRWTPAYVRAQAFMFDDDLSLADVARLMMELERAELVVSYEGGKRDQRLSYVRNFTKHQRVDKPQPSKLPAPPLSDSGALFSLELVPISEDSPNVPGMISDGREGKGREKEGSERVPRSRASALPKNFDLTDSMKSWAKEKAPDVDVKVEFENFRDWHQAKGSKFIDWNAALRTWLRKSQGFKTPAPTGTAPARPWY